MHDISYRNRRLKWQRSIDVFRTKREQEVADSLESGINKGFKILKKKKSVINDQKDTLEKKLEEALNVPSDADEEEQRATMVRTRMPSGDENAEQAGKPRRRCRGKQKWPSEAPFQGWHELLPLSPQWNF